MTDFSRRAALTATLPAAGTGLLAACGSSGSTGSAASAPGSSGSGSSAPVGSGSASGAPTGTGSVNVLYAGSLVELMEKQIGPAFKARTGYGFAGFGAGSTALATQIKGKVRKGDVFVSASPDADKSLMGSANGDWVQWYITYATAPLVLGYNPKSKFAAQLKAGPWYDVITSSGFRIGTTDPKTDPKGKLAAKALTDAGKEHPALLKILADTKTVFPEETLVGDLQSGQLDAGFFYSSEATAASIPTVPLTGQSLKATYTVTVLKGAPNQSGAEAFVQYLLGSEGQEVLRKDGFTLVTPVKTTGSGVPSSITGLLSGA